MDLRKGLMPGLRTVCYLVHLTCTGSLGGLEASFILKSHVYEHTFPESGGER